MTKKKKRTIAIIGFMLGCVLMGIVGWTATVESERQSLMDSVTAMAVTEPAYGGD